MTASIPPQPALPFVNRPTVMLAGSANQLGSVRTTMAAATLGSFYAVDIDLRQSWLMPSWQRVLTTSSRQTIRVRSVWLPETISGLMSDRRAARIEAFVRHGAETLGLRELIVPRLSPKTDDFNVSALARAVNKETRGAIRLAIGVSAESLMRSADHLDRVSAIRRAVEEWDLNVALDVTGELSLRWEAEAAIAKVLPRLTVVRVDPWLRLDGAIDTSARGQLAARTIAMLLDQGYSGIISVHAQAISWSGRINVAATASAAQLLHNDIADRVARRDAALTVDTNARLQLPSHDLP